MQLVEHLARVREWVRGEAPGHGGAGSAGACSDVVELFLGVGWRRVVGGRDGAKPAKDVLLYRAARDGGRSGRGLR